MTRSRTGTTVAALEVLAAASVVVFDVLLPALVLVAMAGVSLAIRRDGPASLGFHRPARPARLVILMLSFAAGWTLLHVALFAPVANHATGGRQDTSAFADLEGDPAMLLLFLALGWTLAALAEETAFRGYLLTRVTDVFGCGRAATAVAILVSAVLFGLIHTEQGMVGVLLATLDGAAFGVLRVATGTLWAAVLAHGFINSIGFVAFYLAGPVDALW